MPGLNNMYILLDGGANVDCRPDMLRQFAVMGSVYTNKIMGVDNPKVGLLNVGAEEEKGRELEQETYALLKNSTLNFTGNVEAVSYTHLNPFPREGAECGAAALTLLGATPQPPFLITNDRGFSTD